MSIPLVQEATNLEIIEDFIDDSRESFDEMESILTLFEWGEVGEEALGNLIQRIHSISTVLRLGGFSTASDYAMSIQASLENVQVGTLKFSEKVNDIIMLSIDHLRALTEAIFTGEDCDTSSFVTLTSALTELGQVSDDKLDTLADSLLLELHKETVVWFKSTTESPSLLEIKKQPGNGIHEADIAQVIDSDLAFFRDMMLKIEKSHTNMLGRGEQILQLCSAMNKYANQPVDPIQLEAAVYMHDFGMAIVSSAPLFNDAVLDEASRIEMQAHTEIAYTMLNRMGIWQDSAMMVKQHHEHVDGKGYPEGITDHAICDGAKMLAIADTVVAMISDKSYKDYKRPLIRAISEINACKGTQFSQYWVNVFNKVMHDHKSIILT